MGFIGVWKEGRVGLTGADQDWRARWEAEGFSLIIDKSCFGIHTDWYLHRYGGGGYRVRMKRGGYPLLRVQHPQWEKWGTQFGSVHDCTGKHGLLGTVWDEDNGQNLHVPLIRIQRAPVVTSNESPGGGVALFFRDSPHCQISVNQYFVPM